MLASAAFGAIMLVAAVLVIVDAVRLPETSEAVGPAAVPLPVGVLLGVFGAVLLIQARAQLSTASRETTWQPQAGLRLLGMVVALVAFAVLLPILGYVVSSDGAVRGGRDVAWGAEVLAAPSRTAGRWRPSCSWCSTA